MPEIIKLRSESFFQGNFNLLKNDFTFLVNNETFCTNKFLASLLSPTISNLLSTDETLDSFVIDTNSHGDFQILLNVFGNCDQEIPNEDKEFICEVLENLGNKSLQIDFGPETVNIAYENVFSNLFTELNYPRFYQKIIDKKISILSSNLYRILSNEEERQILLKLELEIIERILSDEKLLIESEDQLLEFINSLYEKNRELSFLYEYVNLANCSPKSMQTFLNIFSFENVNEGIWNQMKGRLEQPIDIKQRNQKNQSTRYHFQKLIQDNPTNVVNRTNPNYMVFRKGSSDFDGIISFLRKQTNSQTSNQIVITASSIYKSNSHEFGPYNSIQYEKSTCFTTENQEMSYICFNFGNHKIIPTDYTIRSRTFGWYAPVNFRIEGSNNFLKWHKIDKQKGGPFKDGKQETLTFSIDPLIQKPFKYIRLIQTGKNSSGSNYLCIESIEFYGTLLLN